MIYAQREMLSTLYMVTMHIHTQDLHKRQDASTGPGAASHGFFHF